MTVSELFEFGINELKPGFDDCYKFDCECLFEKITGVSKIQRIIDPDKTVDDALCREFFDAVKKRKNNVPLQYILGEWEFMGLNFKVGEGVLIPRPETELLVECANEFLREKNGGIVFDLCAGSGAIGLSVAYFNPNCTVYLIEKFDAAFKYLTENSKQLNLKNVKIIKGDIFDFSVDLLPNPDVILSNPPYIKNGEVPFLQKEVGFEPDTALKGGEDGLDFYREIFRKWYPLVNENGMIAMECGDGQSKDIANIFSKSDNRITVLNDFNDIDRIVKINV